jgi:DNA polymerase-3 subunit alpha
VVSGKVRLREDRVQISCEEVRLYQPPAQEEEVMAVPPVETTVPVAETAASTASAESRRLIIRLSQTNDKEADRDRLHKVTDILRSFTGNDEVRLQLTINGKIKNLRFFDVHTNYCPELHQRLVALVGEAGLRLETTYLKES